MIATLPRPMLALVVTAIAFVQSTTAARGEDEIPSAWLHDAELTAVEFVDAEHGWVVGDRGVMWRTEDGGKVWHLVKCSATCRLETVSFADAEHGWIAGGDAMPYVHASRGVMLATTDGGRTWTNELKTELPRIWKLQLRAASGWAFGESSPLHGDGIFATRDGGRTWSAAVPEAPLPAWTAADAPRGDIAVVAAANGVYAVAPAGRAKVAAGPQIPICRPRSIKFADATDGWLAGDNGLLLRTNDGGKIWQDARGRLSDGAGRNFDFHALEVRDRDIWLAGSPGTLVWHSTDAGETWTARPTGQTAPIKAIAFVDRHRGWAVGALGRILSTRDGGHTWRVQLGSLERASLLGIHATIEDVPLAAYALSSGNDGHLSAAVVMHERFASTGVASQDAQARRLHDAVVAVGGCAAVAASRFPLPDDGELWSTTALMEAWNQSRDPGEADAMTQYEEYLVRQIRTWRPEAIITHDPANAAGRDTLRALVATAVLNAAQKAGDPRAYPQHLAQAALQPWRVKRIFGQMAAEDTGPIELPPTKVAPRLGKSLGEAIARAQGQLVDAYAPATSLAFRTLVDQAAAATTRRDFFSSVGRDDNRDGRRDTDAAAPVSLSAVQQRLVARRNAQGILVHAAKNPTSTLGWLGQLDALAKGLDDDGTAEIARQLADQYETQGEWDMAAEAHRVIAQRYAATPLGPPSLAWLMA
ncbi:MAG: YCF48-related protein, partial [Pirellulales bacterium]